MEIPSITGKRKERDTVSLEPNKGARTDEYSMEGSPMAAAHINEAMGRIIHLNPITAPKNNMLAQLEALGNQILTVATTERETEQAMKNKFQEIKGQFDAAFNAALDNAITTLNLAEQTAQAEEAERMMSEEDKLQRARQVRTVFLQNMNSITDRMTMELTVGQQAELFQYIETQMKRRLEREYTTRKEREPNQLARLSEVSSIALSYALQQLSVTITNIYNTGPELATQIIAILTAAAMVYNYLPAAMRGGFTRVPYFGPLFEIMNTINPEAVLVQNSIATVTTIFYLLRNTGMDQTESIRALGSMTTEVLALCTKQTGRFICNTTTVARANLERIGANLQTASTTVLTKIADRLGYLLTREYQEQSTFLEDSQLSSSSLGGNTIASARDVSVNASIHTANSQESMKSVEILLDTPVTNGGIDLSGTAIPSNVVDERFNIIASEVEVAEAPMPVAEVEQYFGDSQETAYSSLSGLTTGSSELFAPWFWSRGGKRIKRSRRHMKSKRTRKGRKGRKGRVTKKGKKHNRTLKRYRAKMRR